jgi:hypothetical protein
MKGLFSPLHPTPPVLHLHPSIVSIPICFANYYLNIFVILQESRGTQRDKTYQEWSVRGLFDLNFPISRLYNEVKKY